MDKLEKIEKIIEKTGVSYAEAKNALEEAGEDLLDAIVLLESQGKIKKPEMGSYTTNRGNQRGVSRGCNVLRGKRR